MDFKTKVADWDLAYDSWILVKKPEGMLQKDYAVSLGVTEAYLSSRFSEIRSKRILADM